MARARKALPTEALTLREVQPVLGRVLKDVTGGRLEPRVATWRAAGDLDAGTGRTA